MNRAPSRHGFSLLEVMIALAVLSISLVALANINAGAIAMHAFAKKLMVATTLAKGKMLDVESQIDREGPPSEGSNIRPSDGDFEAEGYAEYKWKVEVNAPKSDQLDPTKLMNTILGTGDSNGTPNPATAGAGLAGLLGGASGAGGAGGLGGAVGGLAGAAMAGPASMMMGQITQMVREVKLTVTWMDGKVPQEFTVVEHLVTTGPNAPVGGTSNSGNTTPDPTKITP